MDVRTGITIYETVFSVDFDGSPLTAATFSESFFIDGVITTAVTLTLSTIDLTNGSFSVTFVPVVFGIHQYSLRNNITGIRYVSDIYRALPNSEFDDVTIYVGF